MKFHRFSYQTLTYSIALVISIDFPDFSTFPPKSENHGKVQLIHLWMKPVLRFMNLFNLFDHFGF
jgi:hypothetical protein